jgi:hypothetical protein
LTSAKGCKRGQFQPKLVDRGEVPDPAELLLQPPDRPLGHAVALGLVDEGVRACHAEKADFALEVSRHGVGAVVAAQGALAMADGTRRALGGRTASVTRSSESLAQLFRIIVSMKPRTRFRRPASMESNQLSKRKSPPQRTRDRGSPAR